MPNSTPGTGFDLTPPSEEQFAHLVSLLDPEQSEVLLDHETQAPFCGVLPGNGREGVYTCRLCGLPLFRAGTKFESGTGWPSFAAPFAQDHLKYTSETSFRMVRTEISCARCGGHQGHVFRDGPPPRHERYCINAVSLDFTADGEPLPDKLARGAPEGRPCTG